MTWQVWTNIMQKNGASTHVVPLNDLREHETDKGAFCWCRPEYDEEYDLYVHRSMDGREEYEEGGKPT